MQDAVVVVDKNKLDRSVNDKTLINTQGWIDEICRYIKNKRCK